MSGQWYYLHDGTARGPFSEEEIKEHAARQMLFESDLLWQGGREPMDALPAAAALDFSQLRAMGSPIPDWVADIAAVASKGPAPGVLPTDEIPEWLEDLRLWFGLELYTPAPRTADETVSNPTPAGALPDWLQNWTAPEKPRVAQQDQAPPAPAAPAIPVVVPGSPPAFERPVALSGPAQPSRPSSASVTGQTSSPVTPQPAIPPLPVVPTVLVATPTGAPDALAKPQVPLPVSVPAVAPPTRIRPTPAETAAGAGIPPNPRQTLLQVSGIDLETGRIVDQEKFHKWKRQQAQPASAGQPTVSNANLFEAFRNARTAIYRWVDDDANRDCVLQADPQEILRKPEIQLILHEYAAYGKGMQAKLLHHLDFLVENRRKYYKAVEERGTGGRPA